VSHGPAALPGVLMEGQPIVAQRRVTCFSDAEEERSNWASHAPFSLEQRLNAAGARVEHAGPGREHTVRDGFLINGQNAASAASAARLVLGALHGP